MIKSPYPPIFNKIAAKKIEPKVGASTCALGNQTCKKKIGIFTKKTKQIKNEIKKERDIL